jgi:anti-sigma factor RsiW
MERAQRNKRGGMGVVILRTKGEIGMDCARFQLLIQERLDGAIPPADERLLEEHVASCEACAEELRTFQAIERALSEANMESAPRSLETRISAEIVRVAGVRRRIENVAVATACVVAGAGTAFGVSRVLNWESVHGAFNALGRALAGGAQHMERPFAGVPNAVTSWSQDPAVVGVLVAAATVVVALLAVNGLRAARTLSLQHK